MMSFRALENLLMSKIKERKKVKLCLKVIDTESEGLKRFFIHKFFYVK